MVFVISVTNLFLHKLFILRTKISYKIKFNSIVPNYDLIQKEIPQ